MGDLISRSEVIDILDKMQFSQGQRAGRELWNEKPIEVQEMDLENFNRDICTIRDYILQLEAEQVVHCKECKHWGMGVAGEADHVKCCEYVRFMVGENGYCMYGERAV